MEKHLLVLLLSLILMIVIPAQSQPFEPLDPNNLEPISHLNAQRVRQLQMYGKGQPGEVAWSPDGITFAVADSLGVWLHDTHDWMAEPQLIASFDTGQNYGDASWGPLVEFSPNGDLLTFSSGSSIRFWDVEKQTELIELQQDIRVSSIAFSPDGKQFVAGGNSQLTFWNTLTWEIEKKWISPQNNDYSFFGAISYSPNGELMATNGNYRGNTQLWNPNAKAFEDALVANLDETLTDDIVVDTEFSPDGSMVVSASLTFGAIRAFDVTTFEEIDLETNGGSTIAFSLDGRFLQQHVQAFLTLVRILDRLPLSLSPQILLKNSLSGKIMNQFAFLSLAQQVII